MVIKWVAGNEPISVHVGQHSLGINEDAEVRGAQLVRLKKATARGFRADRKQCSKRVQTEEIRKGALNVAGDAQNQSAIVGEHAEIGCQRLTG